MDVYQIGGGANRSTQNTPPPPPPPPPSCNKQPENRYHISEVKMLLSQLGIEPLALPSNIGDKFAWSDYACSNPLNYLLAAAILTTFNNTNNLIITFNLLTTRVTARASLLNTHFALTDCFSLYQIKCCKYSLTGEKKQER